MLRAKIKIGRIDYEKSFAELFPEVQKKLAGIESENAAVRFLRKMGNSSMTAVLGIMGFLGEREKQEILCVLANMYAGEIEGKLNEALQNDEIGKYIRISGISIGQSTAGELEVIAEQVEIDYRGLVQNPTVQQKIGEAAGGMTRGLGAFQRFASNNAGPLARAAALVMPSEVEKIGLNILQKEENKRRIRDLAEKTLAEKGIWLTLKDMELQPVTGEAEPQRKTAPKSVFSRELEEKLMDAVVEYLKFLLGSQGKS